MITMLPPPDLPHSGQRRLDRVEGACQVGVDDFPPVVFVRVDEGHHAHVGGVAHQDVDRTARSFDLGHHLGHRGRIRNVALRRESGRRSDDGLDLRIARQPVHADEGSVAGQPIGDGGTDP